ncbi:hypothetical protein PHYBOEH_011691 [Phytophthora boehmeriae]|uniref:J domain-containing protein n=1 Tax=Phytophthora boehmeriae TaxID=109152 RepID=A0A8T1WX08_9STRA|nr:hypothetical protein PHYBOEH_011691 [Phytophthora boehmeriae]
MRRATVGPTAKDGPLFPSARATSGSSRGRNGGLFSSSSSSSGDSDASDRENEGEQRTRAVPPLLAPSARSRSINSSSNQIAGTSDTRRRTLFASNSMGDGDIGGHISERKGLFENDDDATDSLETFHERVKLRQSRKQSEMKALKAQLETAQLRAEDLEMQLAKVTREKEEAVIRTNECQRIVEKRNKQLMKASERMARHSEQFELQMTEMQTKLTALTAQCDQLRTDAATTEGLHRREREGKEQERQHEIEVLNKQHEKVVQGMQSRLHEQQMENAVLVKKLHEIEHQVAAAMHQKPSSVQVAASDEYQNLLKRCEDADAIGRGLKFQLEKEQQEKKYLRKQLTALQEAVGPTTAAATAASVGFLPDSEAASPTNSAGGRPTESDLASFDFSAARLSAPTSPLAEIPGSETPAPPEVSSPRSEASSPSRSRGRSRGFSSSSVTDDIPKPSSRDGKKRSASAQVINTSIDPPEKVAEEKTSASKSTAPSVTFFGKLSSRFKRSSPRNDVSAVKADEDTAFGATGDAAFASPPPPRRAFAHSKVLKERPRMYVAKPPLNHEDESSDSIFGSESSSSDSSDEEENGMPPPPPPPPIHVQEAPVLFPSATPVHMEIPSQLIPSDSSADADSSSSSESSLSSDDDDDGDVGNKVHQADRGVNDKPVPTRFGGSTETKERSVDLNGVSSSSSSISSDDDSDDSDIGKGYPPHVGTKKIDKFPDSKSSSSSDGDNDKMESVDKSKVRHKIRGASQDHPSLKRSVHSPSSSKTREKSRSMSQGDSSHSASKSRMNEYMEARAKKRNEKLKRKQEKEHEETKKKKEYEQEWEKMAQEERERKRKQQQARRNGRRRPASMKTVRVSQMRQQMNSKQQQQQQKEQKDFQVFPPPNPSDSLRPHTDDNSNAEASAHHSSRRKSESKTSESEAEEEQPPVFHASSIETPPLPPEPTMADTELYLRQQARLRERHELQMKKKLEADEADLVRGDIHRRVEMWAFGKELLHMILTLDQISSNEALKKCQLMVVQSPEDDTVRKAYRNIIRVVHPDKLRGATVAEQLEAKELFTVLNQAFDRFKANQAE